MDNDTTNANPILTIEEVIIQQTPIIGGFICEHCKCYRGKMKCDRNIFIAFVGANMSDCWGYK